MKSIDVLAKLFGSINRVKIIRLFLANPEAFFSFQDISRRIGASKQKTRREIMLLKTIGFVKQKSEFVALRPQKNKRLKKIRIHGWRLDELFPLLSGFKNFILDSEPLSRDQLLKRIQKAGQLPRSS